MYILISVSTISMHTPWLKMSGEGSKRYDSPTLWGCSRVGSKGLYFDRMEMVLFIYRKNGFSPVDVVVTCSCSLR